MTHSFSTLGFISYEDVYITNGVYIFIRKILWSCTIVFLRMSVSFTMYLVRDDLINKWNQINVIDHSWNDQGNSTVNAAKSRQMYMMITIHAVNPLRLNVITFSQM